MRIDIIDRVHRESKIVHRYLYVYLYVLSTYTCSVYYCDFKEKAGRKLERKLMGTLATICTFTTYLDFRRNELMH